MPKVFIYGKLRDIKKGAKFKVRNIKTGKDEVHTIRSVRVDESGAIITVDVSK